MKPLISVIVPTRGRVTRLDAMLNSLWRTVAQSDHVEVVIRCDVDDLPTLNYLVGKGITFLAGSHLDGYVTLASFINQAARASSGEIVLVINDDAEFVTPGWDTALIKATEQFPDGVYDIGVNTIMNNENFVFPCTSRRMVNLIGVHEERLIYNDIWLRDVMLAFDRAVHVPDITIRHDWVGMTPDQQRALQIVQTPAYEQLYAQCVREAQDKIRSLSWGQS